MRTPPSPAFCQYYPVTTLVAVLAVVATLVSRGGQNINPIFLDASGDCLYEPWRLLASTLFHDGPIHLIFNLYWIWAFGTLIEDRLGHGWTFGIYCLLGAGSSAAELAFSPGGSIGLSGVNYGLFGMLWVLGSRDPRFRDAVDRQTIQLMVAWFFFCILLTVTKTQPIGNVAHGAGCLLGALLGWALATRGSSLRLQRVALLAAAFLICLGSGMAVRHVRHAKELSLESAYRAYRALEDGDNQAAITYGQRAVFYDERDADSWWNLGIAYQRAGRTAEAGEAHRHAISLKPEYEAFR